MKKIPAILFLWILLITTYSTLFSASWGKYTLYSLKNSTSAQLIDLNGSNYHTWTFSGSARTGYSCYMMPDGTLVRTVDYSGKILNGGGMCGRVQKVDWNNNVTWDFIYSSATYCTHHDICPLSNGNVLMISYDVKSAADAVAAGCSKSITIWSEKILEVKPTGPTTGEILWEWKVWDHLCQNYNSSKNNYVTSIVQNPQLFNINYNTTQDWLHMNGIDYNETLDQITFSSHMLNEVYVIDHSTTTAQAASHSGGNSGKGGDILYRWGNPAAYGAAGTRIFNVVHDAHFIPSDCPNAGYLVGFNNNGISVSKSSVELISTPRNGYNYNITLGSAYLPATYTQRIACTGHTNNEGNSQQLPNGNSLICIAQAGLIYEVDGSGNTIWTKSIGGFTSQAFRYSEDYLQFSAINASITASKTSICLGSSVQLNASATGGSNYTYSWASVPAGFNSTIANPTVSPIISTKYIVTINSGTLTDTASVYITVNSLPNATISSGATSICEGSTLKLTANTGTGLTYKWLKDGQAIANEKLNELNVTSSGKYELILTNSAGCSDTSDAIQINIIPKPNAKFTYIASTYCEGGFVRLSAEFNSDNMYQWYKDSKVISGAQTNTYDVKENGNYYLIVKNKSGCEDTSGSIYFKAMATPTAALSVNGNAKFCEGDSITLQANILEDLNYIWLKNNSVIPNQNANKFICKESGSYKVIVYYNIECGDTSDAIIVNTLQKPAKPQIVKQVDKLIASTDDNSYSYQWFLNGNLLEGENSKELKLTYSGNYQVKLRDENLCYSDLSDVFVYDASSISDATDEIQISPNPGSGEISIYLPEEISISKIEINDYFGRNLMTLLPSEVIDISKLGSGMYFVTFRNDNKIVLMKKYILLK